MEDNFNDKLVVLAAKAIELQTYAQQVGKVAKSRKLTTRQLNKLLQAQRLIQKAADMLDDLPFDYPNDKEADMVHEDVSDADIEAALLDAIREATEKK